MNILIVDDDKAVTDSIEFIILEWAERNHCKINYQIKNTLKDVDPLSVLPYDLILLDSSPFYLCK